MGGEIEEEVMSMIAQDLIKNDPDIKEDLIAVVSPDAPKYAPANPITEFFNPFNDPFNFFESFFALLNPFDLASIIWVCLVAI